MVINLQNYVNLTYLKSFSDAVLSQQPSPKNFLQNFLSLILTNLDQIHRYLLKTQGKKLLNILRTWLLWLNSIRNDFKIFDAGIVQDLWSCGILDKKWSYLGLKTQGYCVSNGKPRILPPSKPHTGVTVQKIVPNNFFGNH